MFARVSRGSILCQLRRRPQTRGAPTTHTGNRPTNRDMVEVTFEYGVVRLGGDSFQYVE